MATNYKCAHGFDSSTDKPISLMSETKACIKCFDEFDAAVETLVQAVKNSLQVKLSTHPMYKLLEAEQALKRAFERYQEAAERCSNR